MLSHPFLLIDTFGYLIQLLLKSKIFLQIRPLVRFMILVQDAIKLPFDIIQLFIIPTLQAFKPLIINNFKLFERAKFIEVFFGLFLNV